MAYPLRGTTIMYVDVNVRWRHYVYFIHKFLSLSSSCFDEK